MSQLQHRAAVPTAVLRHVVELACLAPSVHNTQPWQWRLLPDGLELHADPRRRLAVSDTSARNMVISCGAALHHAQVAARALGWPPEVQRCATPSSTLLARMTLLPGRRCATSQEDLALLHRRCTDRRRLTAWPVPAWQVVELAELAQAWEAYAVPVLDSRERFHVDRLVDRARETQSRDERLSGERRRWVDRLEELDVAPSDALLVLCTARDDAASWLGAGEALSAVWLGTTGAGLSLVPLTQVAEVAETRRALRDIALGGVGVPHLLMRLGWQPIGRSELVRTPRRPVDEVLLP